MGGAPISLLNFRGKLIMNIKHLTCFSQPRACWMQNQKNEQSLNIFKQNEHEKYKHKTYIFHPISCYFKCQLFNIIWMCIYPT